jgi:nucleoside-diphosphate-sugar epimerase
VNAMEVHAPDAQLLFSSSVAIYGDRINSPNITINDPKLGVEYDHYSRTKVAAEEIIVSSNLNWSIYRLSAIMGIGNHKISAIMFHVPLNTPMEITTVRDTANAFVQSLNKREHINHNIFNLGGGEQCRISYNDFMTRAFEAFGMGPVHFPEYAFAHQNFHCGYYADGDELEEILKFRSDTLDTYFERFRKSVNPLQRIATRPFAGIVKWFLARLSEPLKAYKNGDQERIEFFFGDLKS